jgi:hypothetical protein
MAKRLVQIHLDTDDDEHVRFVNDLWARLPDLDVDVVLDARCLDRANADYDKRYGEVRPWNASEATS